MYSDPIADMLTRIRNASRAEHEKCDRGYRSFRTPDGFPPRVREPVGQSHGVAD